MSGIGSQKAWGYSDLFAIDYCEMERDVMPFKSPSPSTVIGWLTVQHDMVKLGNAYVRSCELKQYAFKIDNIAQFF